LLGEFECIARDIQFSADGDSVAVSGDCPRLTRRIKVWNIQKKVDLKDFDPLSERIASIAFVPETRANLLVSGGTDGQLRIWSLENRVSKLFDKDTDQGPLRQVLFSPDGRWLVTVGENATIKFWAPR
jgi:WD40 repeat protein